jgi:Uncharacterized protein conserved in bacteria
MRRSILAVFLLVAGCAVGAPAATPSPAGASPSAPPPSAPTATATSTAAPTATAGATAGYSCDPDTAYYGCDTAAPSGGPTAAPTAAPSPQGSVVVITQSSGAEPHFLGPSGNALYNFDNDSPTQSACGSGCTDTWPPLIVTSGFSVQAGGHESDFGTLTRDDGSLQLTYKQRPLYYYSGDASASDINGDGLFGKWHLVHP